MRKTALLIGAMAAAFAGTPAPSMATENATTVQSRQQFNGPLSNAPILYSTNIIRRDLGSSIQRNPRKRKRGSFLGPGTRKKHTNGIHRSRQLKRKHARNKK
ncbi:MAG: BA14K family protein [Bacteriophage sp.]|nr:MAG: BA14K family protein [Bacteriophage sp.]